MNEFEKSFRDSNGVVSGSTEAPSDNFPEFPPPVSRYPSLAGRNRQVKNDMSDELITMGLPLKSVVRILNLDQK